MFGDDFDSERGARNPSRKTDRRLRHVAETHGTEKRPSAVIQVSGAAGTTVRMMPCGILPAWCF
jgi:hypothetical protein